MKHIKGKGRYVIGGLCIVFLILLWIYSSSFSVVRAARRVMTLQDTTDTALDWYASDLRVEDGAYGEATIIPLSVAPNDRNTSTVWVWYDRRIFSSDGEFISGSSAVARWTIKREHGQWKVIDIYEPTPTTEEGQQYFWVRLLS